jgi:hypothetical protein
MGPVRAWFFIALGFLIDLEAMKNKNRGGESRLGYRFFGMQIQLFLLGTGCNLKPRSHELARSVFEKVDCAARQLHA